MAAAIILANILGYRTAQIGVRLGFMPIQLLVALPGLGIGVVEYLILRSESMVSELTFRAIWLPTLQFGSYGEIW
ncbi:hypothetical protein ACFLYB_02845 [Chloroflexota bacterium]